MMSVSLFSEPDNMSMTGYNMLKAPKMSTAKIAP